MGGGMTEPFSRNPSEYERMIQERRDEVARRNDQYDKLGKSNRLAFLNRAVRDLRRPKAEKEAILHEIRELEVALGVSGEKYNSEKF